MNLYQIASLLKSSGLSVIHPVDIMKAANVDAASAYVYAIRMIKKGLLFPVENGKYSISNDLYVVASQVFSVSCISFISALSLHGNLEQVLRDIFIVAPKYHKKTSFGGMTMKFVRFPSDMFFGFSKVPRCSSYIMLAEMEKAIIDSLYRTKYTRFNILLNAIENYADHKKLIQYLNMCGRESVIRRAGYLMDLAGIKHNFKPRTHVIYKLNPSIEDLGELDKKWKLYINEYIVR
jgi:Predicted transcriptional regulator